MVFLWVSVMSQALMRKMDRIEALLVELNAKIDNFLGFEDLEDEEEREVEKLRKEVESGEYVRFEEVFGE